MLRIKAPAHKCLMQSLLLEADIGDGESNVAVSLANYGMNEAFFQYSLRMPSEMPVWVNFADLMWIPVGLNVARED